MMRLRPGEIPVELQAMATVQRGLLTIEQARLGGVSRRTISRRLKRGIWRLEVGAIVLDPTIAPFAARMGQALQLWGGPDSVVSGRTAMALHGIELDRMSRVPRLVLVQGRPAQSMGGATQARMVKGVEASVQSADLTVRHLADAVLDVLPLMEPKWRDWLVDTAARLRWLTPDRMRRAIECRVTRGVRHAGLLHSAAARVGSGLDSEAEAKCMTILAQAGLSGFQTGFVVDDADGRPLARIDIAHVPLRVAIEIDGWEYHGTPAAAAADKARQVELAARGWRVLRFSWGQLVQSSAWVAQSVRRAMEVEKTSAVALADPM